MLLLIVFQPSFFIYILWYVNNFTSDGIGFVIGYIKIFTLIIIIGFKYFEVWCGPNELLLLVGRIVIFNIRVSYQPELWDEFRLNLGLSDRVSEINPISSGDLKLCVFRLTRMSGPNGRSLWHYDNPTAEVFKFKLFFI